MGSSDFRDSGRCEGDDPGLGAAEGMRLGVEEKIYDGT